MRMIVKINIMLWIARRNKQRKFVLLLLIR